MTEMEDIVLVDGARTPHGELLGALADVRAPALGSAAIDGVLDRTDLDPARVDWAGLGTAIQAGVGQVPGRQAVIGSQLPRSTAATTVNEASGSGVRAIAMAADRIAAGRAEFAIAGGMESMSNAPYLLPEYREGRRHGDSQVVDAMIRDGLWDVDYGGHMGEITEDLVEREGVDREKQDEYAVRSHRLAAECIEDGTFEVELVPVETNRAVVEQDQGPRPESTVESLGQLRPAFREGGTITAGNASKLADGAGCVLLADAGAAREAGLDTMARVEDYATAYRNVDEFNESVGDVIEHLLDRNDLDIDDIDLFEINEAFAAQTVYVRDRLGIPDERLNTRGGAIAFGHPIGASGGMLAASLGYEMEREDASYALLGMSVGGGGAIMTLLAR